MGARCDHGRTIKPKSYIDDLEQAVATRTKISLVFTEARQRGLTACTRGF
jgi:hypothetical protein